VETSKNLCALLPLALHNRVREEQEKSGQTLSTYITNVLTSYYERAENAMKINDKRTLAFQVSEELYQRIKDHLAREKERTGKRLSQRDFVLGLIEQALEEAEARDEVEHPGGDEPEDTGEPDAVGICPAVGRNIFVCVPQYPHG